MLGKRSNLLPSRVPNVGLALVLRSFSEGGSEAALHENRRRFAPLRFKSCLKNGPGCSPTDRGIVGIHPAPLEATSLAATI
jgi:hypothetical protein